MRWAEARHFGGGEVIFSLILSQASPDKKRLGTSTSASQARPLNESFAF
jgi:hypothetical protein